MTDSLAESGDPPVAVDQRSRIIDAALQLMGDQGASTTSMRQLATACDINVATLYHYFPSKSDLLRAVIDERAYQDDLAAMVDPPVSVDGPPERRLSTLLAHIADLAMGQESVWRLFLGEAVHSDEDAMAMARSLSTALEDAFVRWIPTLVPEYTGDAGALSRLLRSQLFGMMIEVLVTPDLDRDTLVRQRTDELAAIVFD